MVSPSKSKILVNVKLQLLAGFPTKINNLMVEE